MGQWFDRSNTVGDAYNESARAGSGSAGEEALRRGMSDGQASVGT